MARNLSEAFAKTARKRPKQIAIQWKRDDHWVNFSYGELYENIKAMSSALSSYYRIMPGEKAAILIGNRPEWPITFFSLLHAGVIPVPVNPFGSHSEVENILSDSDCRIAFIEGASPLKGIRTITVDSEEFKQALYLFPEGQSHYNSTRDDTACIMYTSGTTAHPKGVMLSHGNLLSNMRSLYKLGLMKDGDGIISVLPLYHTYAMVVTTVGPLVYGGRVVYPGSIRSKEVMLAIKESEAVLFVGVPVIFEMFHKAVSESIARLPGVLRFIVDKLAELFYAVRMRFGVNLARYLFYGAHASLGRYMKACMSGGARLKENVERDLFKYGFTVLNGYGLTETSPVISVNPLNKPKIGSVGRPIENVEVKIGGKNDKGVGEIWIGGPNVMKGYFKNEELTSRMIKDGWLKTGDTGYIDKDGYLFITGRADDNIALGTGLSISPDEIEEAYMAGPHVKEMCVFDVPSRKGNSGTPALWAVAVPDMAFFNARGITDPYPEIKGAFEKVSRALSIPERLMGFSLTLDILPRTLIGKIKRREVKGLYSSGRIREAFGSPARPSESGQSAERDPSGAAVIDCLKAYTGIAGISMGDSFEFDLGIDLVGRAELAFELNGKLGLKISEEEINALFTVGELIECVKGRL